MWLNLSSTQWAGSSSPWMLTPTKVRLSRSILELRSACAIFLGTSSLRSTLCRSVATKKVCASKAMRFRFATSLNVEARWVAAWMNASTFASWIGCPGCPSANASWLNVRTPCCLTWSMKFAGKPSSRIRLSNWALLSTKDVMADATRFAYNTKLKLTSWVKDIESHKWMHSEPEWCQRKLDNGKRKWRRQKMHNPKHECFHSTSLEPFGANAEMRPLRHNSTNSLQLSAHVFTAFCHAAFRYCSFLPFLRLTLR